METQTLQAACRCCGSTVQATASRCEYCGNPIRITTLRSASELSKPVLMKYLHNYEAVRSQDESSPIALGIIALQLGQFTFAKDRFDEVIKADPSHAEAYFYRAIAVLQKKKPFMCPRPVIDEALRDLDSAYLIEQQAIYKYFSALIRFDYFHRKKFRVEPHFMEEFEFVQSIGIGSGDLGLLLTVINIEVPSELKI